MIYLMRHGADPSDRYGGWSTYGLTEKGREQVHNAKGQLCDKGITQIYSSDLVRAKETAEIVAKELALEITYLPQFREANNGLLAGMLKTEAVEKYPGMYWNVLDWTENWPGGESPEQFFQRIQNAWREFKSQVGDNNVLLVSHGGVMNIILCLENGIPYTNKETRFPMKDAEIIALKETQSSMEKQIILLNGSSSAGKTTLAKALQALIEEKRKERYEIVSIDDFLKMATDEVIYEDDVYEISGPLCEKVMQVFGTGQGVIIDHVITSKRIFEQLKEAVSPHRLWMVQVTCPLEIIQKREQERKDRCPGSAEASYTYLYPKEGYDLTVDTHFMTASECAVRIWDGIM